MNKLLIIVICINFLLVSCAYEDNDIDVAFISIYYNWEYDTYGRLVHDIVRFFCTDPNVPKTNPDTVTLNKVDYELQTGGVSYMTVPGQYYLEYTCSNDTTWYMIYEIILYKNVTGSTGTDPDGVRARNFKVALFLDGPVFYYPYEYKHGPEPELGTPPLNIAQRYVGENHGPIINSEIKKLDSGQMTMWYGKLYDD